MLDNLTVKTRLTILLGFLCFLLIGIGLIGLFGMSENVRGLQSIYADRLKPVVALGAIRRDLLENRLYLAVALVTPEPDFVNEQIRKIDSNIEAINKTWDVTTHPLSGGVDQKAPIE